jgi:hypothetical protein
MGNDTNNSGNPQSDLRDSARDLAKMKSEPATIDLPDVKDIPGQEYIVPPLLRELADETISSKDEEGEDIFGENIEDDTEGDPDSDVSASEIEDLEEAANDMPTEDDISLRDAALDNTDEDGTPLNEGSSMNNISGTDLDVPGTEDDDEDEKIGEEDEENNTYSLGGDNHDEIPGDNF